MEKLVPERDQINILLGDHYTYYLGKGTGVRRPGTYPLQVLWRFVLLVVNGVWSAEVATLLCS